MTHIRNAILLFTGRNSPDSRVIERVIKFAYKANGRRKIHEIRVEKAREKLLFEGYFEYTVYPLEVIWDLTDEGRKSSTLNKDELVYTIMIRQPEFVTQEVVDKAFENVRKKKPHPVLDQVTFGTMEDGLSVQMMHIGSYDDEGGVLHK